tara:strand:+ start:128 stop:511 length:384 start_codon:yes stop_codon:yes gene_type:complete
MRKKVKIGSNKSFGITFSVIFILISLWFYFQKEMIIYSLIILSIIFFSISLIKPAIFGPINVLWFKFGMLLGRIMSPIIFGIIFFLVATPTGLLMKIFKKDLLHTKKNNNKTYWEKRNNISNMRNQF